MRSTADVVVCGAGIGGVAAAYHLAVRQRVGRVVIVDEREPLTLTSDKGTQAYRNWWPGPDATMHRFVSRSIDLLEESAAESGNAFRLNRRGYLFATAREAQVARITETANQVSSFGMGAVRTHVTVRRTNQRRPKDSLTNRTARTSCSAMRRTLRSRTSPPIPLPLSTSGAPAG